jgi:3-methyladenine DNA glycosylase AlkD
MEILKKLRNEIKSKIDQKTKNSFKRFFKEEVKCYGVKTGVINKISKDLWKKIKNYPKTEIFTICEELFKSDFCEEAFIVSNLIPNLRNQFEESDFEIFEKWISKYINNWAKCDSFCNHSIGDFLEDFSNYKDKLFEWAISNNLWVRRASVVSLIVPVKQGKYLQQTFKLAEILLNDKEDMVQKGYGWLLKEASRKHQEEVFKFVIRHKSEMPRTSLRYAIELMPKDLRTEAMQKN